MINRDKISAGISTSSLPSNEDEVVPNYRKIFRYNSPLIQVILVSIVAFGCPGMFNALSGMGGSGQLDTRPSRDGNIALHAVGAVFYLFVAPIVYNTIGVKWTILAGGLFYPLYGGSLLAYNHIESYAFVVAASALLGVGSTFFWVGQGAIITSEPLANEKGRMIGLSWFILNIGGVIGDFIAMGLNWESKLGTVSDATYAVFIALMGAGWLSAVLLLDVSKVVRTDGSRPHSVTRRSDSALKTVWKNFLALLRILPRKQSICMIPFFFMSNYFYSYQQNSINGRLFDVRTRSFNSAMYWLAQMIAAVAYGTLLDYKHWTRKRRGLTAYLILFALGLIVWGGGLALQLRSPPTGSYYKLHELDMINGYRGEDNSRPDLPGPRAYAGPFLQYFAYGAFDALWQNLAYWIISCFGDSDLDDEDDLMARYVGLYKSICGVGQSIAWKVNTVIAGSDSQNYNIEFGINWGLIVFALIWLAPVFLWIEEPVEHSSIKRDSYDERDEKVNTNEVSSNHSSVH